MKSPACYEMLHRSSEAGFCEHGNELSDSIKGEKFLDWVSDYWLLEKNCALWSSFKYSPAHNGS
jgi:hypothetical protein